MERQIEETGESIAHIEPSPEQEGLYVYSIALSGEAGTLGAIGIEGCEVLGVAGGDLCAAVHRCPAEPYRSKDADVAASWVMAHHRVVDAAWRRWGTVLPLTFNTIIKGEPGRDARACLLAWLEAEHEALKLKLDALAEKAEYGVQVFWDPQVAARQVAKSDAEVRGLEQEIKAKSHGVAYMYRQKLEAMVRKEMETAAAKEFRELYDRLSRCGANIHVDKAKRAEISAANWLLRILTEAKRHDKEASTRIIMVSSRSSTYFLT